MIKVDQSECERCIFRIQRIKMSKKTFTQFVNHLQGFTQRIIDRYPNTKDFIEQEKQLGQITSPPPRQGFKMVTDTLHRPFPNSLIVHTVISQSECPIFVRCVYLDTQ